jgi:hypothetical protein
MKCRKSCDRKWSEVTDELLGDPIRRPRRRSVALRGEHERDVGERDAVRSGASVGPAPVSDQAFHHGLVDRHRIRAMGLGRPQHRFGRSVHVGAGEADGGVAEIDLGQAHPSSSLRRAPVDAANRR